MSGPAGCRGCGLRPVFPDPAGAGPSAEPVRPRGAVCGAGPGQGWGRTVAGAGAGAARHAGSDPAAGPSRRRRPGGYVTPCAGSSAGDGAASAAGRDPRERGCASPGGRVSGPASALTAVVGGLRSSGERCTRSHLNGGSGSPVRAVRSCTAV